MTWRQTEVDERYRVTFVVFRCTACGKQAVTTHGARPGVCSCQANVKQRRKR